MIRKENLTLVSEWDKTFAKSEKTDHCKVTFVNRYGITLAADMYVPKDAEGKLPAIAVSGPFGAVFVHRRKRRKCKIHGFSGHQHRRFHGSCRLPVVER